MKVIRELKAEEHGKTRALYEQIFKEDTREFVDYYYQYKAGRNRIYVIEETKQQEALSMLHLNPYRLRMGEGEYDVHYIVAVATREDYRHQGMMRRLLEHAAGEMYHRGEPFTFLMPAAKEIYLPFDFRFIYNQNQTELIPGKQPGEPELEFYCAGVEDVIDLERFASKTLPGQYCVYSLHDEEYFKRQLYEQACQSGSIVIMTEQGLVKGYFYTAEEETPTVQEAVMAKGYESQLFPVIGRCFRGCEKVKIHGYPAMAEDTGAKQVPSIMARIIHLKNFMEGFTAKEPVELEFYIDDKMIAENTGFYTFRANPEGAWLDRAEEKEYTLSAAECNEREVKLTIAQLTELAFGYQSPGKMHLPPAFTDGWNKLNLYQPVYLNEIV